MLTGLAAAHLLKDAVIKTGQVPTEVLLQLKQGPAKHIKNHAYAYRRKVDAELTKIGRIRDMQQRAVALTGTAIIAASVSTGKVLGRLLVLRRAPSRQHLGRHHRRGGDRDGAARVHPRRRLRPQGAEVKTSRYLQV